MAFTLKPIHAEDLIFTDGLGDNCTNTTLILDDYDWMHYILKTRFNTKEFGILDIEFEYIGAALSYMHVGNENSRISYPFNSGIFIKYICQFLTKHMFQWYDQNYVFNGEDIVIAFYNEILESCETDGDSSDS